MSILAKNNLLWNERIQRRFSNQIILGDEHFNKKGLKDNSFRQYMEYDVEDFFREHLTEAVESRMIELYRIRKDAGLSPKIYYFLNDLFSGNRMLILIKSIVEIPVILTAVFSGNYIKNYGITSDIQYMPDDLYWHNQNWHKENSGLGSITKDQLFEDIIDLLNKGYYIVKNNISLNLGNKLLKYSMAKKSLFIEVI